MTKDSDEQALEKEAKEQLQQKIVFAETKPADSQNFEAALAELEKIVGTLEGEVKLEEALALFDRGLKLSQSCEDFLKSAEQKIEVLKKASANGTINTEIYAEGSE